MCAFALATHAEADLYKWTDAQGKVHYSDQPPSENARLIGRSAAGQAKTTAAAQKSLDDKELAFKKRREEEEKARAKAQKEAEDARARAENCSQARHNLSTLQNTPRVYTTNAAGQRSYMDDTARATALANSQKAVADFCK